MRRSCAPTLTRPYRHSTLAETPTRQTPPQAWRARRFCVNPLEASSAMTPFHTGGNRDQTGPVVCLGPHDGEVADLGFEPRRLARAESLPQMMASSVSTQAGGRGAGAAVAPCAGGAHVLSLLFWICTCGCRVSLARLSRVVTELWSRGDGREQTARAGSPLALGTELCSVVSRQPPGPPSAPWVCRGPVQDTMGVVPTNGLFSRLPEASWPWS